MAFGRHAFAARFVLAANLSSAVVAFNAAADSAVDAAAAQALFDDGKALMSQGRYDEACAKFAESQKLDPGGGTLLHLGLCHEAAGKTASAWVELNDALSAALQAKRDDRAEVAKQHLAKLEPRLSKLVLTVAPAAAQSAGVEIKRDGFVIRRAEWGTAVPIDPGAHVITAAASGKTAWTSTINVDGDGKVVAVSVPELQDAPRAAPPRAERNPPAPSTGGTQRAIGVVLAGLGVAGIAVGTVFGLKAKSKQTDAEPYCHGDNYCLAPGIPLRDDAIAAANVSTIAFVAGAASLVAGAVVFLTAPRARKTAIVHGAGLPRRGGVLALGAGW